MDSNIQKGLAIGIGVILFIVVAAIGLGFVNFGQGMASDANEELVRFNDQLTRAKFSAYDTTTVSGTDVVSAIRKYSDMEGDIIVQVTNGAGNTYQYLSTGTVTSTGAVTSTLTARTTTTADISNAKDSTNSRYVNPSGQFSAIIGEDANEVIRVIVFVQN